MLLKCSPCSKNCFFFFTPGYFLRTLDNSNLFLFPLKVRVIGSRLYDIYGHPLFFRLASNAFPDIWSVGRIAKKKNHTKSRNRRPWYPRMTLKVNIHIFGLTKCTIYCKNVLVFVPVFLYTVTMLISQIKRIISSEKGLTAS